MVIESAGGAAAGSMSDTDGFSWELFRGDDAEEVLEDIMDGATAFTSGTVTGVGRKNKLRPRMRGAYMGLKLSNSTAAETWAVNRILYGVSKSGKVR